MLRYLRLYLAFVRFSFSRAMEFRVDFFFRFVMDVVFYATQLAFFSVLYRHTDLVGGWDLEQIFIFVSGFFLVDALHMTIFASNMWWLPMMVNKGDLDYYLVRPVSSLFFLSLRDFAANSFLNVVIAFGICTWALSSYSEAVGIGRIGLYFLFLFNGAFLYYVIHLCFLIPVFWMHSGRGLGELFFAVEKYGERPERIFGGWLRRVLVSVLPFSLIASVPAEVLIDGFDWGILRHVALVTGGCFGFLVLFWGRALRAYSSASS
ncbi:MAG: ABC-2 type transport system permease protein [Planctomycetota bacterium]|jgi:ABC-2 type transport system permease protein